MKITVHTLFQNEARWLWYSVNSVIDYVDKILLWNAGSSDSSYEIAKIIKNKYPEKVSLKQIGKLSPQDFTNARQDMLDQTDTDWFLVVDGDEIWWEESIKQVVKSIKGITGITGKNVESIVVPTINLVGDIFHFQDRSAGKYQFGQYKGHYNLRAVNRKIPGLYSKNPHGTWGWADGDGKMIQDRNTFKFINAPYLHATFLSRGEEGKDKEVPKRQKKLKYEIGNNFPFDFYYPEVFFKPRPHSISSPWYTMDSAYKLRAFWQTPIRRLKRKVINVPAGY